MRFGKSRHRWQHLNWIRDFRKRQFGWLISCRSGCEFRSRRILVKRNVRGWKLLMKRKWNGGVGITILYGSNQHCRRIGKRVCISSLEEKRGSRSCVKTSIGGIGTTPWRRRSGLITQHLGTEKAVEWSQRSCSTKKPETQDSSSALIRKKLSRCLEYQHH